ncbi:type II toxin-antitoxin system RelE family toxin [Leifsonia sp. McL0607]|uniref:type II toxin-antitoxin system RelE family toxin n=1 Tax=Leifsonia sp. McL0607 TaxID=3415672 RepID=UPI003CF5FF08
MTYEAIFSSPAARDLERIPPRIVSAVIEFVYGDLSRSPRRFGKPLSRELEGLYSARRGPYRVLCEIDDDQIRVLVVRVDHRADVYRRR